MKRKMISLMMVTAMCFLTACSCTNTKTALETEAQTTEAVTTDAVETTQQEEITTEAVTEVVTEETTAAEETTAEAETTVAQETTADTTAATTAATTVATTAAATTQAATTQAATTQAATLGANPYVYRGLELETDAKTGKLVTDSNGYYTKIGQQKPLTVKQNDKGGTRIDVYAAEPGPYFIIDIASYKSQAVLVDCTYEGKSDKKAKIVTSWWDGKKLNVVLYCQQVPHNCLYVLDLSKYTDQIKADEEPEVQTRNISIVYKTSEGVKYSFKIEAVSKTLDSSNATNATLVNLVEDTNYYYIDLSSDETGAFRAKYDKSSGKITLEV